MSSTGPRAQTTERGSLGYALVAAAVVVAASLPVFLTGALVVQLRADLGFGAAGLGLAVGAYRGAAALAAVPLGRIADRLGPTPTLRGAVALAVLSLAAIAGLVQGLASLVACLVLAGAAYALGQTAVNAFIATGVREGRQGMAFGIKQSAIPASGLLAGLAVPAIALAFGWRPVFWLFAALGIVPILLVPRVPKPARTVRKGLGLSVPLPAVLVFGLALAFGIASGATGSAFLVDSAVTAGVGVGTAGLLLAVGSALAIVARITSGTLADRWPAHALRMVLFMLVAGSLGYVLMASGLPWVLALGALVALAMGWGFNGVFWFSIVRLSPGSAGAITGVVLPIGLVGGALGPVAAGWVVEATSYTVAWAMVACWLLLAAVGVLLGRAMIRRGPQRPAPDRPDGT